MKWFERFKSGIRTMVRRNLPGNLWIKCKHCSQLIYKKALEQNQGICPQCGAHFRINHRIFQNVICDQETVQPLGSEVKAGDPLNFADERPFADRLQEYRKRTGIDCGIWTGLADIDGRKTGIGIHEFGFAGGSLGSAEGERLCRLIDHCKRDRIPLVIICLSGGARMQEGALSLMQMAKVNAKLAEFSEEGLPYISLIADPTAGGVAASYGLIGDINIAEPNALIQFAGEIITGSSVSETELKELRAATRSEAYLENGFLDMIVPRGEIKQTLSRLLALLCDENLTNA